MEKTLLEYVNNCVSKGQEIKIGISITKNTIVIYPSYDNCFKLIYNDYRSTKDRLQWTPYYEEDFEGYVKAVEMVDYESKCFIKVISNAIELCCGDCEVVLISLQVGEHKIELDKQFTI